MLGESLPAYELFIYSLQDRYPIVETTTLAVIRQASDVATVEGDLIFRNGFRLRVMEVIRFDLESPRIAVTRTRYGGAARSCTGTTPSHTPTIPH
jgi:hypothetical protein